MGGWLKKEVDLFRKILYNIRRKYERGKYMGSFLGTCYLSHLPISYGERVVIIPVIKVHDTEIHNACYPTDNYVPFGLHIRGTYNEYGGIENPETIEQNIFFFQSFDYFRKENDITKVNVFTPLEKTDDFEEFVNNLLCSYKEIYVDIKRDNKYVKTRIDWLMIHEALFDNVLMEIGQMCPVGAGNEPYCLLLETRYRGILDMYRKSLLRCNEAAENSKDDRQVTALVERFLKNTTQCIAYDIVGDMMIGADFPHWQYWAEVLLMAKDYSELLLFFIDRTMFTMALGTMRNGYHCNSGAGSNEYELKLPLVIADFVQEYYERKQDGGVAELFFNS